VFAAIGTGVAKFACCHPDAVSLVNAAEASSVPVLDQRLATCEPPLVELR